MPFEYCLKDLNFSDNDWKMRKWRPSRRISKEWINPSYYRTPIPPQDNWV
ncbi:MAG: hypothetical protein ACFFDK_19385 [Promethearchaeota archaeon]